MDLTGRVGLLHAQKAELEDYKALDNSEKPLPLSTVAELLDVNRTSVYYAPKAPSDFEIMVKHKIEAIHTESPSWGSRQISKILQKQGIKMGLCCSHPRDLNRAANLQAMNILIS